MSLKEYEVSVSEEVYRKIWDFINELNEKERHSKSWETWILEWLHYKETKDYKNQFTFTIKKNFLFKENHTHFIILGSYAYRLLVLYAFKNGSRSLNRALELLSEEAKEQYPKLKEKSYTDNIRLKILAEYIQLLKEGS